MSKHIDDRTKDCAGHAMRLADKASVEDGKAATALKPIAAAIFEGGLRSSDWVEVIQPELKLAFIAGMSPKAKELLQWDLAKAREEYFTRLEKTPHIWAHYSRTAKGEERSDEATRRALRKAYAGSATNQNLCPDYGRKRYLEKWIPVSLARVREYLRLLEGLPSIKAATAPADTGKAATTDKSAPVSDKDKSAPVSDKDTLEDVQAMLEDAAATMRRVSVRYPQGMMDNTLVVIEMTRRAIHDGNTGLMAALAMAARQYRNK